MLDVAGVEPDAFVAVTTQVIAAPESAATKVYVLVLVPILVAPRFHWYAYDIGKLVHVPLVVFNTLPNVVVPLITGVAVLTGADDGADVRAPFTAMFMPICMVYQRAIILSAEPNGLTFVT